MSKDISETIKVFVRERPTINNEIQLISPESEKFSGIKLVNENNKICTYYSSISKTQHSFKLDKIFQGLSSQEEVYADVAKPIVDSALKGYSGTILAYGPTSSGKTFTMRGDDTNKGIMPR